MFTLPHMEILNMNIIVLVRPLHPEQRTISKEQLKVLYIHMQTGTYVLVVAAFTHTALTGGQEHHLCVFNC